MSAIGWLVHSNYHHGYAQWAPVDGSLGWCGSQSHAHVLSLNDATALLCELDADKLELTVTPDAQGRAPRPRPDNSKHEMVPVTLGQEQA